MHEKVTREIYTHGHPEAVLRSHRWRTVENSAAYLIPRLARGRSVLDVGCGPGTITADLAERVAPGPVVGIDTSAEVVVACACDHTAPNLAFRTADVYRLDDPDGAFDLVHAHQVLQHLTDPVGALVEMRRVCRRGGTVAVRDADYAAMAWWPDTPDLERWRNVYRTVARANGGEPDAGRRLMAWARAAGLTDVTASASVWCFASPGDRSWWAETWAHRTTASPLAERAVELGVASRDELAACADAWHGWASHSDAWFVVVHGEILASA
jgi:SAM-dependent methyltransferase